MKVRPGPAVFVDDLSQTRHPVTGSRAQKQVPLNFVKVSRFLPNRSADENATGPRLAGYGSLLFEFLKTHASAE